MKARKEITPYQKYVEAMEQSGECNILFSKDPENEKQRAEIFKSKRTAVRQLVELLQGIKNWVPVARNVDQKITDSNSGEDQGAQGASDSKEDLAYRLKLPSLGEKGWTTFAHLHEYSSKMIGEWNNHLMWVLGCSGVSATGSALVGVGVFCFLSHAPISALYLALIGVPALFAFLPLGIAEAVKLTKISPKAIPALRTRGHLKRFFNTYPNQVEACTANEIVLNHIRLPAEAIK